MDRKSLAWSGRPPETSEEDDKTADWRLVKRIQAGDDRAFEKIMACYKRPVLNFVYRMISDATEAQDVAQDVFVRAYRHMRNPEFREKKARFSTWLFQIARNAALDCLRRRRRHPSTSLTPVTEAGHEPADSAGNPSDNAHTADIGREIAAAVSELPEDQRTALVLFEYDDLSHTQIADIMDCSEKSVEARLYRARRFLRHQLRSRLL